MSQSLPKASIPDPARLIADMADGDENARRLAYRRIFSGELGRVVLADLVSTAGFGQRRGFDLSHDERVYADAQQDLAVEIAATAGYGREALAVMILTETLEGQDHDRHDGGSRRDHDDDREPEF